MADFDLQSLAGRTIERVELVERKWDDAIRLHLDGGQTVDIYGSMDVFSDRGVVAAEPATAVA